MKKHHIFQTAILALLTVAVSASEVTLPNEFVAGERARAGEVNENFEAVKEAVDDNHSRLSTAEGTLNAVASRVPASGAVSLSHIAFHEFRPDCTFNHLEKYGFFEPISLMSCDLYAPLTLPHGATITGASCLMLDSEETPTLNYAAVIRANLATEDDHQDLFGTDGLSVTSAEVQTLALINKNTGGNTVNNTAYAYYFRVDFNFTGLVAPQSLRLYNCKVSYGFF
jgi:hypothetical protein